MMAIPLLVLMAIFASYNNIISLYSKQINGLDDIGGHLGPWPFYTIPLY